MGEASPVVLHPDVQSSVEERPGPVGAHPEGGTQKWPKRWNTSPAENRLRKLGLFILEKRRLRRYLRTAFQYLKRDCKKEGNRIFHRICWDRGTINGFKLKQGRFREKGFYNKYSESTETDCTERWWRFCPRDIQGPNLVVDVSVHCRGVGADDHQFHPFHYKNFNSAVGGGKKK